MGLLIYRTINALIDEYIALGMVEELAALKTEMTKLVTPEQLHPFDKLNYDKIVKFLN